MIDIYIFFLFRVLIKIWYIIWEFIRCLSKILYNTWGEYPSYSWPMVTKFILNWWCWLFQILKPTSICVYRLTYISPIVGMGSFFDLFVLRQSSISNRDNTIIHVLQQSKSFNIAIFSCLFFFYERRKILLEREKKKIRE